MTYSHFLLLLLLLLGYVPQELVGKYVVPHRRSINSNKGEVVAANGKKEVTQSKRDALPPPPLNINNNKKHNKRHNQYQKSNNHQRQSKQHLDKRQDVTEGDHQQKKQSIETISSAVSVIEEEMGKVCLSIDELPKSEEVDKADSLRKQIDELDEEIRDKTERRNKLLKELEELENRT